MKADLSHIKGFAYGNVHALNNTYGLCIRADKDKISGAFIECGIANGAHLAVMHMASPDRKIIGFDSFQGIPMAGEHDTQQPGIGEITHDKYAPIDERLVSSGVAVQSLEQVRERLNKWNVEATLVPGWFQHTIHGYQIDEIAVLRLDGDLYESTIIPLEEFVPKIPPGGWVIIDDYALRGCQKAVHDYFGDIELTIVPHTGNSVRYYQIP